MVQSSGPVPPSRQIAEILRGQIRSGKLSPGDRIPSLVTMSQTYEVAPVTVAKAFRVLKSEGWIETVTGYGTFVAATPPE
jgi:DNA-binding GntR family transcriptional regulator